MPQRLPAEIHLVRGTTGKYKAEPLPIQVRERVPKAAWIDNPDLFDRDVFIDETSTFLWETYGIGCDQDKHVLAALAAQIEIYVECIKQLRENGLINTYNSSNVGISPYFPISDKSLSRAIVLMNELGLTPKSRLASGKAQTSKYSKLLTGP